MKTSPRPPSPSPTLQHQTIMQVLQSGRIGASLGICHFPTKWAKWCENGQWQVHCAPTRLTFFTSLPAYGVRLFTNCLWSQIGWKDDQKRATKPTLPSYLRYNIPNHISRALSRLRLAGHNLNIKRQRKQQHRVSEKGTKALSHVSRRSIVRGKFTFSPSRT